MVSESIPLLDKTCEIINSDAEVTLESQHLLDDSLHKKANRSFTIH